MKLGIMQPYIFPYLGYFQLINAVDRFVVYNDVNFIKQGWINRNRILLNGQPFLFVVPLKNASSFRLIHEIELDTRSFALWRSKFYKTLEQAYRKAYFFNAVMPLIQAVFDGQEERSIGDLAEESLKRTCEYLNIDTPFVSSQGRYNNKDLSGQQRVIDICRQEEASEYINATGGRALYSFEEFAKHNLQLSFIEGKLIHYPQLQQESITGLSIIDVMMFNSSTQIKKMLDDYQLIG